MSWWVKMRDDDDDDDDDEDEEEDEKEEVSVSGLRILSWPLAVLRQVMKDPGSWSQHDHGEHRHYEETLLFKTPDHQSECRETVTWQPPREKQAIMSIFSLCFSNLILFLSHVFILI